MGPKPLQLGHPRAVGHDQQPVQPLRKSWIGLLRYDRDRPPQCLGRLVAQMRHQPSQHTDPR